MGARSGVPAPRFTRKARNPNPREHCIRFRSLEHIGEGTKFNRCTRVHWGNAWLISGLSTSQELTCASGTKRTFAYCELTHRALTNVTYRVKEDCINNETIYETSYIFRGTSGRSVLKFFATCTRRLLKS